MDKQTEEEKLKERMEIHQEVYKGLLREWVNARNLIKGDGVVYTQVSVVAISQLAAVLGVDLGMSEFQFVEVCRANFQEAYDRAPKFGD